MHDTAATAECLYMGKEGGSSYTSNTLIEYNLCYNTTNSDSSHGSGFQIKTGSYNVVMRNNVFWNNNVPCMLFYDDFDRGQNIIENNICIGTHDYGIQVTAGAIIRNNIIVNAPLGGIAVIANDVQPGKSPRNVQIYENTIIGGSSCLYISTSDSASVAANNALFDCSATLSGSYTNFQYIRNAAASAPSGYPNATVKVGDADSELLDTAGLNFYPRATSALVGAGNPEWSVAYDFNGVTRSATAPTIGAYEWTGPSQPAGAWQVQLGLKTLVVDSPSHAEESMVGWAVSLLGLILLAIL